MSARFHGPQAEESVACNLIPMIDVMFLLLLFFMLGADMSQRELEEVRLPIADGCVDDPPDTIGAGRTTVNVFHGGAASGVACEKHAAGGNCRDPAHWLVAIRGAEFLAGEVARQLEEESAPRREVMVRADEGAPYVVVQKVIEGCAAAGRRFMTLGAARPTSR